MNIIYTILKQPLPLEFKSVKAAIKKSFLTKHADSLCLFVTYKIPDQSKGQQNSTPQIVMGNNSIYDDLRHCAKWALIREFIN